MLQVAAENEEEKTPWVKMRERSEKRIRAAQDRAAIEGKITPLMRVSKGGPVATAEKALTAEADWPGAEFLTAGAPTATGMAAASNVVIFSEGNRQRLHRVLP